MSNYWLKVPTSAIPNPQQGNSGHARPSSYCGYTPVPIHSQQLFIVMDLAARITIDELLVLTVTQLNFVAALRDMVPSATREVAIAISHVGWEDIGGLAAVKRTLIETVEWPLRYPHVYARVQAAAVRGILLTGVPRTGKTLLARAIGVQT